MTNQGLKDNNKLLLQDGGEILETIILQLESLKIYLKDMSYLRIGTLGPQGTTSYFATQYFIEYIKKYNRHIEAEILLEEKFDIVTKDLLEGNVDLIIVPNAYEKITDMYWNPRLSNLFTFLLETPKYAIASRVGEDMKERQNFKLASCSPVLCLVDYFMEELNIPAESYEIIRANSTTRAAEMVENKVVDMAITNATSIEDRDLEFISSKLSAQVLWSIFCKK